MVFNTQTWGGGDHKVPRDHLSKLVNSNKEREWEGEGRGRGERERPFMKTYVGFSSMFVN